MKKVLSALICAGLLIAAFAACGAKTESPEPQTVSQTQPSSKATPDEHGAAAEIDMSGVNSFSAELFRKTYGKEKGKNTFISPISVYAALAMLNNGAVGQTQEEICGVLSGENTLSPEAINYTMNTYSKNLETGKMVDIANGMFVMDRKDITMNDGFIKTAKDEYSAEIIHEVYSEKTIDHINSWVNKKTHKMIPILITDPSTINESTVSVLLNAVAFEGEWAEPIAPESVYNRAFHNYSATETETEFMSCEESRWLEDDRVTGFMKSYSPDSNERYYSFVAILPKDGVSIDDYIDSMTADTINDLVRSAKNDTVYAQMPKLQFDMSYKLPEVLQDMGMTAAFSPDADFTELARSGEGNCISVGNVIHATHLELDEKGTRASGATAITMYDNAIEMEMETHEIILDRPYVFAIYDHTDQIPLFVGAVCEMGES